ncbi:MAG: serine hydrolase domain-containing protein [Deinococcales bacterium]
MRFNKAKALLVKAIEVGDIPGAVAIAGDAYEVELIGATGVTSYVTETQVTADSYYDLASLTKVIATLPAVLQLIDAGALNLDDYLLDYFPNAGWFQEPSLAYVTVRELLSHSSGLEAWRPLFALSNVKEVIYANVLQSSLGEKVYRYSDLGFILLGMLLERIHGQDLREISQKVFGPLGLKRLKYGPLDPMQDSIAATEDCGWRMKMCEGIVHDENAYALGGAAGHAGLFGIAEDVARYAQAWLKLDEVLASRILLKEAQREQCRGDDGVRRGLGWQLGWGSTPLTSPGTFGHTGFSGTSLWIDPEQGWFAVLLTNRIHPNRRFGSNIQRLRSDFHEAIAQSFIQKASKAST